MSVGYNFLALPQNILDVLYKNHLTGTQMLVLLSISEEVLKYSEGRKSLTRELSYRYIAKKINIDFQTVGKAIKKLAKLGLIEILKVGKRCVGSLIKLNISSVAIEPTYKEKVVAIEPTKQRNNIKEKQQTVDVIPSNSLLSPPEKYNFFGKEISNITVKENIPEEIINTGKEMKLSEVVINTGIKTLRKRECNSLKSTLQDIFKQLQNRYNCIKNKAGYFLSLCEKIEFIPDIAPEIPEVQKTNIDELTPEKKDRQERKEFGLKIYNDFTSGKIKYVLNPAGLLLPIISMDKNSFCYRQSNGTFKSIWFIQMPEKLRNEDLFCGEENFVELKC